MENLTDSRKSVETGLDPRLLLVKPQAVKSTGLKSRSVKSCAAVQVV